MKKSLGNTSRENALATGSVTPDIAATIGLRPVPEPRVGLLSSKLVYIIYRVIT